MERDEIAEDIGSENFRVVKLSYIRGRVPYYWLNLYIRINL